MAKLRVSVVQYLNTAPLVWGFTDGPNRAALQERYELSFTVPSLCAEALRSGDADVAIIPAIEYARIPGLAILPGLSIASKNSVRSLLILSKKPIREVRSLALDRSSRSTQAITRILCADHWKISPQFLESPPDLAAMLGQADAALLIGDPALRLALSPDPQSTAQPDGAMLAPASLAGIAAVPSLYVYDIVEQWHALTGLPAVLAIWAVHASAATAEVARDFLASRDLGVQHIAQIGRDWSPRLELPAPALERYLAQNIDYSLDAQNLAGLNAFFTRAFALSLIPSVPALVFPSGR
jgi:chorismate dehydratase